jgi:hypothetical protein
MAGKKTAGVVLLVVGIVIVALSLAADTLGVGNPSAFGPLQIAAVVVGGIVAIIGLPLTLQR